MSTHKYIDKICVVSIVISLLFSMLLLNFSSIEGQAAGINMGYEERLFNNEKVHTIDIVIDDWETFLSTAQSEEYSVCSVVIDGEAVKNVGIRGKGNTSLSTVSSMDSDRYSFKIEFDQYDSSQNYYGLDKLCLNNIIQDNTYMKDYLVYQMMNEFGVSTPLCSYAYLTVNGEDWGLYLAVEAVEESFLQRNYGKNYGELYKPDSMSFGGGRGNGKEFTMPDFTKLQENTEVDFNTLRNRDEFKPDNVLIEEETEQKSMQEEMEGDRNSSDMQRQDMQRQDMQMPDIGNKGGFGGMGSSDVKLQYIDDNADSYSNIFDNAKTNITEADQNRLISSLKQLSEYENLEEVLQIEEVLRYFVVHNFVVNEDSYTGSMIHNYYLYEEDGVLSMIPWDYNLAFGTFQGGNASSSVNADIDEVLSDRPMQAWIFSKEEYSQQYYALYSEMLNQIEIQNIIDNAYELIAPYVEKDPTVFCTYEEFQTGVETLKEFCTLRTESVQLQLSGSTERVETGNLNLSDMGTMSTGGGFNRRGNFNSEDGMNGANNLNGMSVPELKEDMPVNEIQNNSIPDNMPNGMSMPDNIPNNIPDSMSEGSSNNTLILMLVSIVVLVIGLCIAFLFKC